MVVIIHNLRSSHNVGSIFRTADAFGFSKIYLCGTTPGPKDKWGRPNSRLLKVSLGAEDTVLWENSSSTLKALESLKNQGYLIVALEQSKGSIDIGDFKSSKHKLKKLAIIVGDEVKGISKSVLEKCDFILEIPMSGKKESLNVAVAFGVASFYISEILQKD